MERYLLILIIISGVFSDSIGPSDEDTNITKREGESVTLRCSYDANSNNIFLYWFRQFPNKEPQYLLWKGARSYSEYDDIPDQRFQSTTSESSTELIINSVTLSDSALYYCALRVGGGVDWVRDYSATDTLTFGKPITLTVLPKDVSNSSPVLSILSPLKGNEQDKKGKEQDICLAGGFFPQEKTMTLILEGKNPVNLQSNNAELFKSSKTYYYAGFNGDPIQTCKMDGEEADTTPDALVTGSPDIPNKPTSQSCETNASSTPASVFNRDDPKMKSMTLLVTGLRILLAKCVAVNVLMTVKAFLF